MMRKFGVENELVNISTSRVSSILSELGSDVYVRDGDGIEERQQRKEWLVHQEICVAGNHPFISTEVVTPVLEPGKGRRDLLRVASALLKSGAAANPEGAGLHVHIGVEDLKKDPERLLVVVKALYKLFLKYEPAIDLLIPESRRGNQNTDARSYVMHQPTSEGRIHFIEGQFSKIDRAADVQSFDTDQYLIEPVERASKLNVLPALGKHGTVEFRMQGATLDLTLLKYWPVFCDRFVHLAEKLADGDKSLDHLLDLDSQKLPKQDLRELLSAMNTPRLENYMLRHAGLISELDKQKFRKFRNNQRVA